MPFMAGVLLLSVVVWRLSKAKGLSFSRWAAHRAKDTLAKLRAGESSSKHVESLSSRVRKFESWSKIAQDCVEVACGVTVLLGYLGSARVYS